MRQEGWERLLNEHITAAYRGSFEWGKTDCALWCAEWVKKATGQDFVSPWLGQYQTEAGAAKLMKKRGYGSVAAIATSHLEECPVPLARRGDIVLQAGDGPLGICNGVMSFFLKDDSVLTQRTLACVRAWVVK